MANQAPQDVIRLGFGTRLIEAGQALADDPNIEVNIREIVQNVVREEVRQLRESIQSIQRDINGMVPLVRETVRTMLLRRYHLFSSSCIQSSNWGGLGPFILRPAPA